MVVDVGGSDWLLGFRFDVWVSVLGVWLVRLGMWLV